jgi:hypothetical protein
MKGEGINNGGVEGGMIVTHTADVTMRFSPVQAHWKAEWQRPDLPSAQKRPNLESQAPAGGEAKRRKSSSGKGSASAGQRVVFQKDQNKAADLRQVSVACIF